MKTSIHPTWYPEAQVSCVCGNKFTVGSIKEEIRVEICSKCHPFFTGAMKLADTEGIIDKFAKKVAKAKANAPILAKRKAKKLNIPQPETTGPKSLKEMLLGLN